MRPAFALFLILICIPFFSCINETGNRAGFASGSEGIGHAKGFDVEEQGDLIILRVYNPWQGARDVLFSYVLSGCQEYTDEIPEHLRHSTFIRTPVKSVICLSTTHVAMLDFIEETGSITAVSGGDMIFNPSVRDRLNQGKLPGIGYDTNLNYERILELNPDVILAYGVGAESGSWISRLKSLGMNVVLVGEYLEDSPLAQAEWVKFIGYLFGKQDMAIEKFSEIEKQYNDLLVKLPSPESRPVVMSGLPWRNNWFVPGGRSHFARLVDDAGGRYLWNENRGRDNFPVDIERVIEKGSGADYWINTGSASSLSDIFETDRRLGLLRPWLLDNIYNNNARTSPHGGNDYWESGIVNPHIVLKDLIRILHPEIVPDHEPVYFRKLQ